MKASNAAAESGAQHPPLAHDGSGNRLPIPSGTAAWRICRHTEGRPKIIKGPDRQPARLALDTTAAELADTFGADTYRVYALDEVGNVLDYVATVDAGRELRNAAEPELALVPAARSAATTDLRFALEAVTAIARTNAEAMRAVAESQADWIKSISSARGFFRNAAPMIPPPAGGQSASAADSDDDDKDDEDEPEAGGRGAGGPDWTAILEPIVGIAVEKVIAVVMGGASSKAAGGRKPPFDLRDALDWRRAADKRDRAEAGPGPAAAVARLPAAGPPPEPAPKLSEQALMGKALAISASLPPDERGRLLRLAPQLSQHVHTPEVAELLAALLPLPVEEAAAWVRAHLDDLERMFAS